MAEPVGIGVSIVVDTTTVTVISEDAVNVAIAPETTSLSVSSGMGPASSIVSTAYNTISATNVQTAIEQLADQFYRSTGAPSGTNLAEGDLWYDKNTGQLKIYK